MNSLSNAIIQADKSLDYVPFVSFFNNSIDIIAKLALRILGYLSPSTYSSLKDHSIIVHLDKKDFLTCVLLGIPFVNLLFITSMQNQPDVNPASPRQYNNRTLSPAIVPSPSLQNHSPIQEQLLAQPYDNVKQKMHTDLNEIKHQENESKNRTKQEIIDRNKQHVQDTRIKIQELQDNIQTVKKQMAATNEGSTQRHGFEIKIQGLNKGIAFLEKSIESHNEMLQGSLDAIDKL